MVDKSQLTVLKQGATVWNEWRAAHGTSRPELSGAYLCGLDLASVDLSGADCRKADLRGTNLTGALLSGADFEGANFFRTVLDGADLAGANLNGAQFLGCPQLAAARNWQSACRDPELACGAPIPPSHARS